MVFLVVNKTFTKSITSYQPYKDKTEWIAIENYDQSKSFKLHYYLNQSITPIFIISAFQAQLNKTETWKTHPWHFFKQICLFWTKFLWGTLKSLVPGKMDKKYIWQKTGQEPEQEQERARIYLSEMDKAINVGINMHHPKMWSKNMQWSDVINFTVFSVSELKIAK